MTWNVCTFALLEPALTFAAAFFSRCAISYIINLEPLEGGMEAAVNKLLAPEHRFVDGLNSFLDYTLEMIITHAGSLRVIDLGEAINTLLPSELGIQALSEALIEVEAYNANKNKSDSDANFSNEFITGSFNSKAVCQSARVSCMIYSTVNDRSQADFASTKYDTSLVSPIMVIYLTTILEFVGEYVILTAARCARERVANMNELQYVQESDLRRTLDSDAALRALSIGYKQAVRDQIIKNFHQAKGEQASDPQALMIDATEAAWAQSSSTLQVLPASTIEIPPEYSEEPFSTPLGGSIMFSPNWDQDLDASFAALALKQGRESSWTQLSGLARPPQDLPSSSSNTNSLLNPMFSQKISSAGETSSIAGFSRRYVAREATGSPRIVNTVELSRFLRSTGPDALLKRQYRKSKPLIVQNPIIGIDRTKPDHQHSPVLRTKSSFHGVPRESIVNSTTPISSNREDMFPSPPLNSERRKPNHP